MNEPHLHGRYELKPGVKLIPGPDNGVDHGVLLIQNPLRVLKLNQAAWRLLQQCQEGLPLDDLDPGDARLAFLDRLYQAGILCWEPGQTYEPAVSVVVAVYNRAREISACLQSLAELDYPQDKLEIIVVDDASDDHTPAVVRRYKTRLLVQSRNQGQSAARNRGVKEAKGEIVAFLDSDCVASASWLRDLLPYFLDPRVGAVGGYVDSYYHHSRLDRYEEVKSPLNMGRKLMVGVGVKSDLYVPTCNLLVRRQTYLDIGGLDEYLRIGEDVDFCWKLKDRGHHLIYAPRGKVEHKHRGRFWPSFKRRFEYGTSEPMIYERHPEARKRFPWQPWGLTAFGLACLGLVTHPLWFFALATLVSAAEACHRVGQIRKTSKDLTPIWLVMAATWKGQAALAYHLAYHLLRYYFLLLIGLTLVLPQLLPLAAALLLYPGLREYWQRRPRLNPLWFIAFFGMEQIFYQAGVLAGCRRLGSYGCYRITFAPTGLHQSRTDGAGRKSPQKKSSQGGGSLSGVSGSWGGR